jgi:hypothetical protein
MMHGCTSIDDTLLHLSAGTPATVALCRGGIDTASVATQTQEEKRERCWTFPLRPGDAYVLSGDARNYCDHGVLCLAADGRRSQAKSKSGNSASESRQSLNLRFGLHPWKRGAACSAYREIYHQFDLDPDAKKKQKPLSLTAAVQRALAMANQLPSMDEEGAAGEGAAAVAAAPAPAAPAAAAPAAAAPVAAAPVVGGKPHGLLWAKVLRIHSLKGLLAPHDLAWCRAYSHSYSCAPPLVNTFVLLLCCCQVAGHPFWPSRRCTPAEEAKHLLPLNIPHEEEDICVCFLGAHNL